MLKTVIRMGAAVAVFSLPLIVRGQAMPTATGHGQIQIGGGATMGKPDYGQGYIGGYSIFGDYDLSTHFGIDGAVHMVNIHTPADVAENTFEAGPRYVWRKNRFAPYAKILFGRGDLVIQETNDNPGKYSGNYFMMSFGGGIDINFAHHITVRAFDFEYQRWPNLGNGLTPAIGTVGAAYRFR